MAKDNLSKLIPADTDWRTTDAQEVAKRQLRARLERPQISNLTLEHPVFSDFDVKSRSGLSYQVEIRDVASRQFACSCTDFRINGLGTCKHIEAVLLSLARRVRPEFKAARRCSCSSRIDIVPDLSAGRLRVERNLERLPESLRIHFEDDGLQRTAFDAADLAVELERAAVPGLRVTLEAKAWLRARQLEADRRNSRRDYELGAASGGHPAQETLLPLFPYQREGMLHLAFNERALLADEMGLGKTIQAVAACALLHRLGKARRVLIVTPASLKSEWEEQIRKFTPLDLRLVFGSRSARAALYADPNPPFFTVANYEQVLGDTLDINARLRPDIVVLDEAQRIKNWSTRTAQAVKRLRSRYAFVLTGTPIENRIDELHSLVDFLDPSLLGPLFRFNREYYQLDDKGRPEGYRNLNLLKERIRPILLRRRKADVETELPSRQDRNLFVALTPAMRAEYAGYEQQVAELVQISKRRPLTPREQDMLMVFMNIMRMICDSPAIVKGKTCRDCPKLAELGRVLDEVLSDPDVKVIVFSEWEGMLRFVRERAENKRIGYAWHTGTVPQRRRRAEITAFRTDPACRIFLSTDSGGVGLNLQCASVVINCDLPWNPARLEQRIARAWRKNQRRSVTVVNLIAEKTLEHGMLGSLADKMDLARGILDGKGDLTSLVFKRGRQETLKRLEQVMLASARPAPLPPAVPADPPAAFCGELCRRLGPLLVRCDETWLPGADHSVLVVVLKSAASEHRPVVEALFKAIPWNGARSTLHVLDQDAWSSLQAMQAAGMVQFHARATRSLHAAKQSDSSTAAEELREHKAALTERARRKIKAARLLLEADLVDEAKAPLSDALLSCVRATALLRGLAVPETAAEALLVPYDGCWPEGLHARFKDWEAEGRPNEAVAKLLAFAADGLGKL